MPLRGVMTGGGDAGSAGTPSLVTLTLPGNAVAGDVATFGADGSTGTNTVTTPTGWTILSGGGAGGPGAGLGPDTSGTTQRVYVYGKVLTSGDISAGTVAVQWSGGTRTVSGGAVWSGVTLTGIVVGTPVITASGTSLTLPTITTSAASSDVIIIIGNRIGSGTPASMNALTGYTWDVQAKQASTGVNMAMYVGHLNTPGAAGSYGGGTVSWTGAMGPSIAYTIGLAPAGTAYTSSPADTEGATDAATTVVDAQRTGTDLAGITDAAALDRATAAGDLAGLADAATPTQDFSRSPADLAGLTDSATAALGVGSSPADLAGLTDAASAQLGLGNSPVDVAGMTDTATATQALARSAADAAGLTDAVTIALDRITTAGDLIGAIDAAQAQVDRATSPADVAGLTDAATAGLGRDRSAADALALTDSVTAVVSIEVFITDGLSLVDHGYRPRDLHLTAVMERARYQASLEPGRFTATAEPGRFTTRLEEGP